MRIDSDQIFHSIPAQPAEAAQYVSPRGRASMTKGRPGNHRPQTCDASVTEVERRVGLRLFGEPVRPRESLEIECRGKLRQPRAEPRCWFQPEIEGGRSHVPWPKPPTLTSAICDGNRSFASRCGERQRLILSGLRSSSVLGLKKMAHSDPRPRPTKRNVAAELKSYSRFIISPSIM